MSRAQPKLLNPITASLTLIASLAFTAISAIADSSLVSWSESKTSGAIIRIDPVTVNILINTPVNAKCDIQLVENPNRLVVDVPGISAPRNKTLIIDNDSDIASVRLGTHPDKLRVVLDIKSSLTPTFDASQSGTKLSITLKFGSAPPVPSTPTSTVAPTPESTPPPRITSSPESTPSPTPAQTILPTTIATIAPSREPTLLATQTPKSTPTAKPTRSPTASATPIPARSAPPSDSPTKTPTSTPVVASPISTLALTPTPVASVTPEPFVPEHSPTPKAKESPAASAAAQAHRATAEPIAIPVGVLAVQDITFDYLSPDNTPAIKIELADRSEFRITRETEKSYALTVPKSRLRFSHLKLPQFPPTDFIGFTAVIAEESGSDVTIRISVDPGTRLASVSRDNEILVKALNR